MEAQWPECPKVQNYPPPSPQPLDDREGIKMAFSAMIDDIKDDLLKLKAENLRLSNENQSLTRSLESKIKNEDKTDVRKEFRRSFDLAWASEFGPEALCGVKVRIKEQLGL